MATAKGLVATNFLIAVAAAATKSEYDSLVIAFVKQFEELITNYEQHHAPRVIDGDPFPDITKSLNDTTKDRLTQRIDVLRRDFKTILDEAAAIQRTRSEFFLRVQKAMQIALDSDNKSNAHGLALNNFNYTVSIVQQLDTVDPE